MGAWGLLAWPCYRVQPYSQRMVEKPASVEVYCLTKQQVRFLEVLI